MSLSIGVDSFYMLLKFLGITIITLCPFFSIGFVYRKLDAFEKLRQMDHFYKLIL